ncbi:L-rhamnose-binding lectin CSL3-like [Saccostrea cucullata]|uniref:L-rhamnose-binding lectin CSL3-like n=1 Tax=Saccostrea cuccullata TaxID=36930 RepID=UPI002ED12CA3
MGPDQSFAVCDSQKGFIRCTKGTQIQILSANYGRTDEQVCPTGKTKTRTCRSEASEIKTKWNCNGYRTCHLHADVQHFRDPCPNYSKYLEVKYRCVKDPSTISNGTFTAFNAYTTKTLHLQRGTPVNVVYDGVYFNYGNAYNQHTGVFTAPSVGLYVFTWSSCVTSKKLFDVEILLNGKRKGLGNCNN